MRSECLVTNSLRESLVSKVSRTGWSLGHLVSENIPYCLTCDWQDYNVKNNQHKENQTYQT